MVNEWPIHVVSDGKVLCQPQADFATITNKVDLGALEPVRAKANSDVKVCARCFQALCERTVRVTRAFEAVSKERDELSEENFLISIERTQLRDDVSRFKGLLESRGIDPATSDAIAARWEGLFQDGMERGREHVRALLVSAMRMGKTGESIFPADGESFFGYTRFADRDFLQIAFFACLGAGFLPLLGLPPQIEGPKMQPKPKPHDPNEATDRAWAKANVRGGAQWVPKRAPDRTVRILFVNLMKSRVVFEYIDTLRRVTVKLSTFRRDYGPLAKGDEVKG